MGQNKKPHDLKHRNRNVYCLCFAMDRPIRWFINHSAKWNTVAVFSFFYHHDF